jgi:MinD-like ATPase involved in chromosome partitioning or flagellar assembly
MGMDRVFVTVEGPTRRIDIALPESRAVGELIPTLVEMVEGAPPPSKDEGAHWALAAAGDELDPETTLGRAGVADGAILTLRPSAAQPAPREPRPPLVEPPLVEPLRAPTTGLPEPMGLAERLRGVASAVGAGDSQPARDLTVARRTSTLERARQAWQTTDYRRRLEEVIAAPRLRRCVTIAVLSPKGGVGKTTSTVLLGSLLAKVRSDRVVAVDYDPDYGTLGRTIESQEAVRLDELVQVLEQPALTVSMLERCLGRAAHGLMVLPSPDDPQRVEGLELDAYQRVIRRLQQMAGILVLDCGAGVRNPFARAAIEAADQLLLVTDGSPTTASVVSDVAARLAGERDYVLVVNRALESHAQLDLDQLRQRLPSARGLIEIDHEPAAAASLEEGRFSWDDAPSTWQVEARQLAATLATGWEDLGLAG